MVFKILNSRHKLTRTKLTDTFGYLVALPDLKDRRSRVTSQKQRDKGDPAHHILNWSHVEAGCWGWLVQLHHPSVLHGPLERQRELFKGTEENKGAFNVIWPFFVGSVFRQSPILWTQTTCEVELPVLQFKNGAKIEAVQSVW